MFTNTTHIQNTFTAGAYRVVQSILDGDITRARNQAIGCAFTRRDRIEIGRACRKWGIDPKSF